MTILMTNERNQTNSPSWRKSSYFDKKGNDKNVIGTDPKQLAKIIANKSIKNILKNSNIKKSEK
ncbi:hypothetical protein MKX75_16810 [Paenibacillus sp. FSL R5-0341]|uniref:hypothetical protein n=1 Tax=Paenibacillus sp. FSL R5-0341 TaxID=2921636 RepID=UPI0030D58F0D